MLLLVLSTFLLAKTQGVWSKVLRLVPCTVPQFGFTIIKGIDEMLAFEHCSHCGCCFQGVLLYEIYSVSCVCLLIQQLCVSSRLAINNYFLESVWISSAPHRVFNTL